MSRHNSSGSYGHSCRDIGDRCYAISWVVDKHYAGSRLRHPQRTERITNRVGAERFCKKWKCPMPEETKR